jgi:hypothetical protein
MGTGETDVSQYSAFLLVGWDGRSLQWSHGHAGSIDDVGEEPADDSASLKAACLKLKNSGLGQEVVLFHHRHAFFTTAPASVAKGHEERLMTLHLGARENTKSNQFFHSDAFGDELVVMERWESDALQQDIQGIWPHVRFESSSLRWLEKVAADSRDAAGPMIAVDIGVQRALLARFESGRLMWAMVTEDLEGEGLLYHIVNALHRDGLEPASSGAMILLSGDVERGDAWTIAFDRFFNQVEIVQPMMEIAGIKTQRWALLANLASCA